MKQLTLLTFFLLSINLGFAQVPKKVVVEHFTNTRCAICASKNPAFYSNLANHPGILHIAFHPSAPYPDCFLNNHNPSENDARTNFYGVYGSTPRWVIQGSVQSSSASHGDPSFFEPFTGKESPIDLFITEKRPGNGTVTAEVMVKTLAEPGHAQANLFVAYAEDTVLYSAPNGEEMHYDVFRKAFTPVEGQTIVLPAAGDSTSYSYTLDLDSEWIAERMYVLAILQETGSKQVIQSGKTDLLENQTGIPGITYQQNRLSVFPNPASSQIKIKDLFGPVTITDLSGRILHSSFSEDRKSMHVIDVSHLDRGNYVIITKSGTGILTIMR